MAKEETTAFTDGERALIEQVARERDISFDEAAAQLASTPAHSAPPLADLTATAARLRVQARVRIAL